MSQEVGRKRPRGRLLFVGAVVAVLLLAPVVALLAGRGGAKPASARSGASNGPADIASADVPRRPIDPNQVPLPRARPTVVDPQAGVPSVQAGGVDGVSIEGGPTTSGSSGNSRAEIQAQDREYRAFLRQQKSFERLVKEAPGRFAITYGSGRLVWPLPKPYTSLSSPFCERRAWEACHPGVDIPAPIGTTIYAADSGTVIIAGPSGGYGNYTCIQHTKSLSTCYGHQSRIDVRPGQDVQRGQAIGLVGCTGLCFGSHLHFETRNNGQVFDPMSFFK